MTENLYTKDCIRTHSGLYINVFEPEPDMICIEDIAHGLAHQPRFGGHLPEFFSVAEHSISCMRRARKEDMLCALMHDASEAYLCDLPSPIKKRIPGYIEIEDRLMQAIADKFGFAWPMPDDIKRIDKMQLEVEWHCLMLDKISYPYLSPAHAKKKFLVMFKTITKDEQARILR